MTNRPLADLISAFRAALNLPPEVDIPQLKYRERPEWSSVGHMQLIAGLETTFEIMIDTDDVLDLSSFDKAVEILAKYDLHFTP